MKVKIMTYNILNGFCGDHPPYKMQPEKMDAAVKVITKEDPDILVLTEAYFWPFAKKNKLNNIRKLFKEIYNEYTTLAFGYFRWAPVILSKYPIKLIDTSFSQRNFTYFRAHLEINKKIVVIDAFHPHPETSEQQKVDFLKPILDNKHAIHILVGDLNALSPHDIYDRQKLVRGYESFMKEKGKSKVEDMLTCLTLKSILKEGFVDSFNIKNNQHTEFTMPTNLRSKNKDSAVRIDYILHRDTIKTISSKIIKDELTEKASDHYPLCSVLDI